ncbi:MAG: DUF374 domain-containing protein [bacterium]
MNFNNWLYKKILPPISWLAITLLTNSLKIKIINKYKTNNFKKEGGKFVFVCWHGRQFLLTTHLSKLNTGVITSISQDGRLQADILGRMGFKITYGSSSKSPVKALVGSIKLMRKGINMVIAVDGPTGPIYKVKYGALFLAKKMNAQIVPVTFSSHPCITLNAWDKYLLPLPFSQTVLLWGNPIQLSDSTDKKILEKEAGLIEKKLNAINNTADFIVNKNKLR